MNWPNKVSMGAAPYSAATRIAFWTRHDLLIKWCTDNLSSRGVLWEYDIHNINEADWAFYFAQPNDAIMFRLINGL